MNKEHESLREILLNDNNIYKAILSLESYLFNPQLLQDYDIRLLNELNDKFNYKLFYRNKGKEYINSFDDKEIVVDIIVNGGLIEYIRRRIIRIINPEENNLFKASVNFKIKDISDGKYRPLHSASLIDNIAMVSMLQILIFDMRSDSANTSMKLSNLSKLIPYNFYGNIPSKAPERLFEKWQVKYKEYSEIANEKFSKYHETGEYKTEIVLDLVNFFPSVNPKLVFDFIIKSLEVRYSEDELELIRIITYKLLIFEIGNFNTEAKSIIFDKYYEKEIENYIVQKDKSELYLSKGIPQGLPQSYFFGNLIMIDISKFYQEIFSGESFYYVDDSVIYIKQEISDNEFKELISKLNGELKTLSTRIDKTTENYFSSQYEKFTFLGDRNEQEYRIEVHKKGKSHYQRISETKIGYKYLMFMSRLASMGSFDMMTSFDDNQELQLSNKFKTVTDAIEKEIGFCNANLATLHNDQNCKETSCDECKNQCVKYNNYNEYIKKLERFKRFFQYRIFQVEIQESNDVFVTVMNSLKELDLDGFQKELDENILEIKLSIINQLLLKKAYIGLDSMQDIASIYERLRTIELKPFEGQDITKISSLFYFNVVFNKDREVFIEKANKYTTLESLTLNKAISVNKHRSYQMKELDKLLVLIQNKEIVEYVFQDEVIIGNYINTHVLGPLIYWSKKSRFLRRQIYNSLISRILGLELNDNFFITRKSKRLLNYYELRIALVVRNLNINTGLLIDILRDYLNECKQNKSKFRIIDYSIFKAIHYFRTFAREPKYIDNLVLTHKYTSELWENGSKYMHFYTLHNQSHAIELIENTNKILKSINFLKVSKLDYYILYVACYLHDISMVLYPNYEKFYDAKWENANKIVENHIKKISDLNPLKTNDYIKLKDHILKLYKDIEALFEAEVRDKHAFNSAKFIRKSKDLDFIESGIIDHIADVSNGHGMDARDIYHLKSNASERRISLKFMMILLRLADLLDMNENRVSVPIFYNNKKNMSSTTKFHWISHLITGDYRFNSDYKLIEKTNSSYLRPNAISETVTLEIDINIDQLTTIDVKKNKKCTNVIMEKYNGNDSVLLDILNDGEKCNQEKCNFICKWFNTKNKWLIYELSNLQAYLNDVNSYFATSFQVELKLNNSTILRSEDFDDLNDYI